MTQRRTALLLALLWGLSACHSTPPKPPPVVEHNAVPSEPEPPVTVPPLSEEDMAKAEVTEIPPCLPADSTAKPAPKRKPKPVAKTEPPAAPAPAPPPPAAEAGVKMLPTSSSSILGRKVRGQDGDDLGRVVDVLADSQGRVRVAVIEFGGFLGVGNRRIAVDWSLLKFHPEDPDAPVELNIPKRMLQATPEYKGAAKPLALMGPEATAAPRPTSPN